MAVYEQSGFLREDEPASAAQVRDLSAQVQALQAQLAGLHARQQARGGRWRPIVPAGVALLLLAAGVGLAGSHSAGSRTALVAAAPVATPVTSGPGVHICVEGTFNQSAAACRYDSSTVSSAALPSARLSFTGKDGAPFTSTQLTVQISRWNESGNSTLIGHFSLPVTLTSTSTAVRLQGAFDQLGIHPAPATYLLEVDEGGTALGLARFAYTG